MRKFVLLVFFSIFSFSLLSAQDRDVFAPFVSRLKVKAEESYITIAWQDTEDVDGTYIVYRYTREINAENFKNAVKLAELSKGTEIYIDYPLDTNTYYYAVLVRDGNGKIYELFIPFRNKSITGVAVTSLASQEQIAARITGISASVQEDSVLISFTSSKPDRNLILYRGTVPLRTREDLIHSQPLRTISSSETSIKDFPVPGISYYYGIIDSSLVKTGDVEFTPGENATLTPVEISLGIRVGLPESIISRPIPLPLLPISRAIESGEPLSQSAIPVKVLKKPLSPATIKAVTSILSSIPSDPPVVMEPHILDEDRVREASGSEQYTLKSILDNEFTEQRWERSEELLNNYLSIYHSEDIETRSHYYLGQVYYFQGKYRESFIEFLLVRDKIYTMVKPWMDAIFTKLSRG